MTVAPEFDHPDRRSLSALPKAHLHLHFTGSMRHGTLLELAERDGIRLPASLTEDWPPQLSTTDEKGWFRFQRLYDVARSVLRTEDDVRRLILEAAQDDAADGSVWTEIQVDPSGYGARFGGITAFTDLVIDAVRDASERAGIGMGLVVAANRTRHPHGRPYARPARRPVRGPRRDRLRPVQRRAARRHVARSGRRSRSPSGPGSRWCPTAASCGARPTSRSASTTCTPTGSATACAPRRAPRCSTGSRAKGGARGLPDLQRVARRLQHARGGAASAR